MKSILSLLFFLSSLAFAGDRVIINPENNGDLKIKANISGTATDVLTVLGTTGEVSFPKGINRTDDTVFAYEPGDQTLTEAGLSPVNFSTEVTDTNSTWASNVYTASKAGRYQVTVCLAVEKNSGTTVAGDQFIMGFRKNGGSNTTTAGLIVSAGIVGFLPFCSTEIISLVATDTIQIRLTANIGGSRTFTGRLTGSRISISRI